MSRQPSPGLSQQKGYYRDAHGIPIEKAGGVKIVYRAGENQSGAQPPQGASTPVPVATSSSSSGRTRTKAYQSGPVAGAEDVKYAAKYRDLRQKVKEIEADNDRLMFKVLQAKRNIQRAKLERAVLYERLSQLPASPPQANVPLPPQHVVQQPIPPGGPVSRHQDVPGRHQRGSGPSAPHHHHHRHHQQPIQPAPPSHVSPPQHHAQAHHTHHPPRDPAHPGQLPITHAQQVTTIQTVDGPLLVVAGPDGQPVTTENGQFIPAQEIHHTHPPPAPVPRKRGGRVSKEVREMREREAREMREREEMDRKQAMLASAGPNSGHHAPGIEPQRSSSGHMRALSPPLAAQAPGSSGHVVPISSRERERDWEAEREIREHERMQRREEREEERERHHGHHHHRHTHGHSHVHRHHQERAGSPPPPPPQGSEQSSSPQAHRSHSQASRGSYHSHHSHGYHHMHSHSHSASPLSPGGSSYPGTRIHNHQRVGPGSYVLRDRDRADGPPAENLGGGGGGAGSVPATPLQSDDASASAPTPAGPASRVPTPPYLPRGGRGDTYNDSSPRDEDAATAVKAEARPGDEGSGTNTGSATPT